MDLIPYKEKLRDYLISYHNINVNKLFTCLNPYHEDRHPSMGYYDKSNFCKCFSCGAKYDIFDIMKIDYGCDNFKDQLNKVQEIFNDIPCCDDITKNNYYGEYEIADYRDYFKECSKKIDKTNYLEKRGIDNRLLKKYNIGFDDEKNNIIFPINDNSYFARGIYSKFKMKTKGKSYLWNEELLKDSNNQTLIYITEGIIDALSLETLKPDIKVISLNGIHNGTRLLELIEKENFVGNLVLVFDKDYRGLQAQKLLKEELDKLNICSFSLTLISNFDNDIKDVNEALLKDKNKLERNVNYFNENLEQIIKEKAEKMEVDFDL